MKKIIYFLFLCIIIISFNDAFSGINTINTINTKDAVKKINNLLQWEEKFGFSGSVLLVKDGEIILNSGYGYSNKKYAFFNSPQTLYYVASVSKPVTALGIMKLVQQNKIHLYDYIAKYFDNVPEDKKNITIEMLLTHTSGLEHTYSCDNISDRTTAVETILKDTPMLSAPGEKYNYSGDNYSLLAAIIEIASGKKFENFIDNNILKPAGINHSAFTGNLMEIKIDDLASVSVNSSFTSLNNIDATWGRKGRAGLILTTEDLYKLDDALTTNKILPEYLVKSILSPKISNPAGSNYGYGFTIGKTLWNTKVFGHDGDDDDIGHNVVYLDFPQDKIKIFVASNDNAMYTGTSRSGVISSMLQRLLLESDYHYKDDELFYNEFQNYSAQSVEKFEGVYSIGNIDYHVWIDNDGKLIISPVGEKTDETFGFSKIYSVKNNLTKTILEQAIENDYKVLSKFSDGNYVKIKSTLTNLLKSQTDKYGPVEKIEILGTANIWGGNNNSDIATWFKFIFKNKSSLYRLEWDGNGKIAGFGGSRVLYPIMFTLNAIAKDEFIGFDAANGLTIAVNFLAFDKDKSKDKKNMMEVNIDNKSLVLSNSGKLEILPKRSAAVLLYNIIQTDGIPAAINKVSEIKENSVRFDINEDELNSFGYMFLNKNKFDEAIALFTFLVQAFPESANGFDSLGEAYMKSGDKTSAIKNYERSLELDPENDNARKMIDKMK
ncbi:MAG: serine hydrolase [bacterium]